MVGSQMIKILEAIKGVFSSTKPAKLSIEYHDQAPPRIMHSSLEAEREQQTDGWVNAGGRYNLRNWLDKR
jgi:hypothetical protein